MRPILKVSVKSTIPVSCVKVAVHTKGICATGWFKITNCTKFCVSLSINSLLQKFVFWYRLWCAFISGPFWSRFIRQSCGNCHQSHSFADLPSLPLINHYQGWDFPPSTNECNLPQCQEPTWIFFWWINIFTSSSPGISSSTPPWNAQWSNVFTSVSIN